MRFCLVSPNTHTIQYRLSRSPHSLCDGALVIVDAAEGVCIQTHAVLRTAWAEGVRPVLVINKLDRLITELQLSPSEAYTHVCRILEQANVLLSEMYMADLMAGMATTSASAAAAATAGAAAAASLAAAAAAAGKTAAGADGDQELTLDAPAGAADGGGATFDATAVDVDERAEAALFFDPTKGNVLFASAIDGWAFTVRAAPIRECIRALVPSLKRLVARAYTLHTAHA
jgi:ribosome assembly protein 1